MGKGRGRQINLELVTFGTDFKGRMKRRKGKKREEMNLQILLLKGSRKKNKKKSMKMHQFN